MYLLRKADRQGINAEPMASLSLGSQVNMMIKFILNHFHLGPPNVCLIDTTSSPQMKSTLPETVQGKQSLFTKGEE